jgi:probable F420-dependent oxidoreductase
VSLRVGAKLPHSGPLPARLGLATMAARLETAGFDSLWVSDHVVFPREVRSRYPFAADGRVTWPLDVDYLEPVVSLAAVSAATSRIELGTSVLIVPMRNPVVFAKQAASVHFLAHGRLVLGVGAGWLREEFEALGADFEHRGEVLDEWVDLARRCWTGTAGPYAGRFYSLAEAVYCRPVATPPPPILIGGMSRAALERAGRIGDGWLAQFSVDDLREDVVSRGVATMRDVARAGKEFRVVVRVTGADGRLDELGRHMRGLEASGATDVIVDVDWSIDDGPLRAAQTLHAAVA